MTYQVKVQDFEGPLDLLLHLIRKNELDIYTVRISDIANQYLEYIEVLQHLNLDGVGDFLLMAATLAYHKSRMLLPVADDGQDMEEEDGIESMEELHRRLIEYQQFKEAAQALQERSLLDRDVFRVRVAEAAEGPQEDDQPPLKASLFDLLDAFQHVLKQAPKEAVHEVMPERIRLTERIMEVLDLLNEKKSLGFEALFEGNASRHMMVMTFLSILELVRMQIIRAYQPDAFGPILLRLLSDGEGDPKDRIKANLNPDEYG
ncbi:MAG: segregation/condensation protein A [bacterium]